MATVTGFTAARMQNIEDGTVVDGDIVGGDLILTKHDGSTINAGPVIGPQGPMGTLVTGIPGEIKLWPDDTDLPDESTYGTWTWANGGIFNDADYPLAAAHIPASWKTANGLADPGAGKFRVPDLRGLTPAGLDAMPNGSARTNRVTRSVAIILAGPTGKETHIITGLEMPNHAHSGADHWHNVDSHRHEQQLEYYGDRAQGAGAALSVHKEATGGTQVHRYTLGTYLPDFGGGPHRTRSVIETHGGPGTTGGAGADNAHENMQPTIFVPYIVKLDD